MPTAKTPPDKPAADIGKLIKTLDGKTYELKIGQLAFLELNDQHHYWLDGEYMASVTHILNEAGPVPYSLKNFWQTNDKETADNIFETAGSFGTKMHEAFEHLLRGIELRKTDYPTIKEQKTIDCFMRWFQKALPQGFVCEQIVASKKYKYAGTLDFVGKIQKWRAYNLLNTRSKQLDYEGKKAADLPEDERHWLEWETWLIDFKTTSGIYIKHEWQAVAYKQGYEESFGEKIDRVGILRVGTTHKSGYEFKEVERDISEFMNVYQTFLNMNGGEMPEPPEMIVYPDTFKLLDEVTGQQEMQTRTKVGAGKVTTEVSKSVSQEATNGSANQS